MHDLYGDFPSREPVDSRVNLSEGSNSYGMRIKVAEQVLYRFANVVEEKLLHFV